MRTHLLDPYALGENTKPCKGCGDQTHAANAAGDPFCADCMPEEAASSPIMEFYAALPYGLRRAFDVQTALFNSGHTVFASPTFGYQIMGLDGFYVSLDVNGEASYNLDLREAVAWAIEHREELV